MSLPSSARAFPSFPIDVYPVLVRRRNARKCYGRLSRTFAETRLDWSKCWIGGNYDFGIRDLSFEPTLISGGVSLVLQSGKTIGKDGLLDLYPPAAGKFSPRRLRGFGLG